MRRNIIFLTNEMSKQSSFSAMFDLYLHNQNLLKDWTFIVATTERGNMDLYTDMEEIAGIRERLFTPFANGRVSVINDKIYKRFLLKNDSRAKVHRCISFDTQTVSYIERYHKNGTVPYEGFDAVIHLLTGRGLGINYIPYTMENLMFDQSRKDSVEQTLFAYEMMCGENCGNARLCRKRVRAIITMYEKDGFESLFHTESLYKMIYIALLKMCQIQLEHRNWSTEKKLEVFVEFIATKLCRMMPPEINLAKVYFSKGSGCGFFGMIHTGNKKVLEQLKNMTWDIMHLRFMDYSSSIFNLKKCDALIPYFFTYDRRLQDVRECYNLQLLAINTKNYSVIPVYSLFDGILDVIKKHSTFEKHKERMLTVPDVDSLIAECEQALLKLMK